jgi:hypothetical protein
LTFNNTSPITRAEFDYVTLSLSNFYIQLPPSASPQTINFNFFSNSTDGFL